MSGLAAHLRELIAQEGPLPLDRYMALALGHPTLGYYTTRDPLGASGDFTTAPEISQMFGELIGLWAAEVWGTMGAPGRLNLVELGPGRGTLMQDALRAARIVPGFAQALDVHMVETSPVLMELQRDRLADTGLPVHWHASIETIPPGPAIVIANEFFDALPVRHYVRAAGGWRQKLVGLNVHGEFVFGLSREVEPSLRLEAVEGTVLEVSALGQQITASLAGRLAQQGGAALIIDYGYVETGFGETLQAMKAHQFVDPLDEPGLADLTTHVDFAALGRAARASGASVFGPLTQGEFLMRLGNFDRARALARKASPAQMSEIEAAVARLVSPEKGLQLASGKIDGMGELFKVLCVTAPGLAEPAGFEPVRS